jgi:hypothetical protein
MASILSADRFAVVAAEGLGRKSASSAACMAYFRGRVFVGTTCSDPAVAEDAPRILRYDLGQGWETAYESPLIEAQPQPHLPDRKPAPDDAKASQGHPRARSAAAGQTVAGNLPRDSGYRSMCVFQGKSDRRPALYVSTMSRSGAVVLRSGDGKVFEQVSEPGLGDPSVYSFRALAEMNGYLFAAPAGTVTGGELDRNLASTTKAAKRALETPPTG